MRRVYLDYGAATPLHDEVRNSMEPWLQGNFANASAIHTEGVVVREAIEHAREALASTLHIRQSGIVFTSGGTESNQCAVVGVVEALRHSGRAYRDIQIITTKIEHPSLLGVCEVLKERGVEISFMEVDEAGSIIEQSLTNLLNEKTVLVTYAYANSEIGTVQNVKQISRVIKKYNQEQGTEILSHLDASQAPLWLPCALDQLGIDIMTLDAGKCYGPKGVGVLAFRHGVMLKAEYQGGGQEGGLRSGTENVPGVIGCVTALTRAQASWKERSERVAKLRDHLLNELTKIDGVVRNGPPSKADRIANNVNISIPGIDGEFAVITLDRHGIAVSTKSACGSAKGGVSEVVFEISHDEARANSTIRFTLGEETTEAELDQATHILEGHIMKTRAFSQVLS